MRLYISGGITIDPDGYVAKFAAAEAALQAAGYETVNPVTLPEPTTYMARPPTWLDWMKRDIVELMECSGVALLPDWSASPGARVEAQLAEGLGLSVSYLDDWIRHAPHRV